MLERIINSINYRGGIKSAIDNYIQRVLGLKKINDRLNVIYYVLNNYVDISSLPKCKDKHLRSLQTCDTELLRIFHEFCVVHNLDYWLYGGSLLGAVRHKGFIPWDDDTDICMPRTEYEKAIPLLIQELPQYGLEVKVFSPNCPMDRIGIGYNHDKTGIWIDVFPVDNFRTNLKSKDFTNDMYSEISKKVYSYFHKHKDELSVEEFRKYKRALWPSNDNGENVVYYDGMEFAHHFPRIYDKEEIYPLTLIDFEGYKFKCPANYHSFLSKMYGNYMMFPNGGVAHHGTISNSIAYWAKNNNIDMDEVLFKLKKIRLCP